MARGSSSPSSRVSGPLGAIPDDREARQSLRAGIVERAVKLRVAAGTAEAIFIDELQYVAEDQLAVLITAMHRIEQRQLPVVLVGAGLPQLRGRMGNAKSYAERLFNVPEIGPLQGPAAERAIRVPLLKEGIDIDEAALSQLVEVTRGYA